MSEMDFGLEFLNKESNKLLNQFLERIYRNSEREGAVYKSAIYRCLKFVNKSDIREVNDDDMIEYFKFLEHKGFSANYKKNQYHYVNSFFSYVQLRFRRSETRFINPVLPFEEYKFTPDDPLSDKEQQEKVKNSYYSIEQLKRILKIAHDSNYEYYILAMILTFCGMRPSEAVSVRIEDVNIEGRYLLTGRQKMARKSIKTTKNGVYYCFPEEVTNQLFYYIHYLKAKNPKNEWLFPSRYSNSYIHVNAFRKYFNVRVKFPFLPHQFRRTISTYRQEIDGVKTPTYIMETLSNHTISSLEHRAYSQYPIEKRRDDYDRYFPSEYRELLGFIARF